MVAIFVSGQLAIPSPLELIMQQIPIQSTQANTGRHMGISSCRSHVGGAMRVRIGRKVRYHSHLSVVVLRQHAGHADDKMLEKKKTKSYVSATTIAN